MPYLGNNQEESIWTVKKIQSAIKKRSNTSFGIEVLLRLFFDIRYF